MEPFLPLRPSMGFAGKQNFNKGWGYMPPLTWSLTDDNIDSRTSVDVVGFTRKKNYPNYKVVDPIDGTEKWYVDEKLHRIDGPAIIYPGGVEEWYVDGKIHRIGGPAITYPGGVEEWYVDGKIHRIGGPAVTHADGTEEWYVDGKKHRIGRPAVMHTDGTEEWYVDGKLHRIGGPAVTYPDGSEEWYEHDELHRTGGPAIRYPDGGYTWYDNGYLHRENGPAISHPHMPPSGAGFFIHKQWWLNGASYTEEEYIKKTKRIRFLRFKYFHRWYDRLDDLSTPIGQRRMIEHFGRLNDITSLEKMLPNR